MHVVMSLHCHRWSLSWWSSCASAATPCDPQKKQCKQRKRNTDREKKITRPRCNLVHTLINRVKWKKITSLWPIWPHSSVPLSSATALSWVWWCPAASSSCSSWWGPRCCRRRGQGRGLGSCMGIDGITNKYHSERTKCRKVLFFTEEWNINIKHCCYLIP